MGDLGGDYFIPMDITDEEKQLFRTSLNKTQPIKSQNKVVHRKKPSPVRKSVEFAFENPNSSADYVKFHAQEMGKEVVDAHIALYVNNYSISLGEQGRKAVELLFEKSGKESKSIYV